MNKKNKAALDEFLQARDKMHCKMRTLRDVQESTIECIKRANKKHGKQFATIRP